MINWRKLDHACGSSENDDERGIGPIVGLSHGIIMLKTLACNNVMK